MGWGPRREVEEQTLPDTPALGPLFLTSRLTASSALLQASPLAARVCDLLAPAARVELVSSVKSRGSTDGPQKRPVPVEDQPVLWSCLWNRTRAETRTPLRTLQQDLPPWFDFWLAFWFPLGLSVRKLITRLGSLGSEAAVINNSFGLRGRATPGSSFMFSFAITL